VCSSDLKIPLAVRVPRGEGERNASFVIRGVVGPDTYEYRIVRRITVRLAGTEKPEAALEDVWSVPLAEGGRGLSVLFRNTGNISLRPRFVLETAGGAREVLGGEESLVAPGRALAHHWTLPSATEPGAEPARLHAFFQDGNGETVSVQSAVRGVSPDAP
jgi:hypothetical protein